MANTGNSVKDDVIRELDAGSITSSFQPFGSPYLRDSFKMVVTNNTNGDIYLSTDGVNAIKKLPIQTGRIVDDKTNDMYRKAGTQWYIKYAVTPGSPSGWATLEVEYV